MKRFISFEKVETQVHGKVISNAIVTETIADNMRPRKSWKRMETVKHPVQRTTFYIQRRSGA